MSARITARAAKSPRGRAEQFHGVSSESFGSLIENHCKRIE
jgi:hypothetical protein